MIVMMVTIVPYGTGSPENSMAASTHTMKITWFNVGAGDSVFIKLPNGKNVLIDGGTKSKGASIVKKLKNKHVSKIHYMISTHPDADHAGGLQYVLKKMKVYNFYYPGDAPYTTNTAKELIRLVKKEGCKRIHPRQDRYIKGGYGCKLEFVQRNKDYSTSNQDSLAMFLDYGNLEVLFAGDNEKGSQNAIEKHNADIVMLPHHGSKYATTSTFIKRFDPERVVVSTDGHKYGHPNKEVFRRLRSYDKHIKAYRTDKKGDITVTANSKKWSFDKKGTYVRYYCNDTKKPDADQNSKDKTYVYITATGKKYHSTPRCRGLANAKKVYKVKKKDAIAKHLEPCKLCY